jgi:broad-specificity NMP kinase
MKYLITGFPGTGKSAVSNELERRGYKSYNTDDIPEFSHFIDRKTKRHINKPANAPSNWNINHDWVWKPEKINEALNQNGDVFICAITPAQVNYYGQFDKIFVLTLDEMTMKHRIATRTTNDYGKNPEELEHILRNYKKFGDGLAKSQNAILIDATQPLKEVVDDILNHTDAN